MLQIIGLIVIFVMIFGGYVLEEGDLAPILHAAPFELMMIMGGAVGAMMMGNSGKILMDVLKGLGKTLAGPKWKKKDYADLLALLFTLTKTMKTKGVIALETHIENSGESAIFTQYPKILKDHFATDFICDTLRMMTMNLEDPHQVEDNMEAQLEKHHHEAGAPAHALQTMADGLPALGIVAAVLGIVKTMGAITEPPEYLGRSIGAALVGTFLGIFLAYGIVGPLARACNRLLMKKPPFTKSFRRFWSHTCTAMPPRSPSRSAAVWYPVRHNPALTSLKMRWRISRRPKFWTICRLDLYQKPLHGERLLLFAGDPCLIFS
ncbi:MAG: flagellar motor stator protein MotA [Robiginitomaculum sp.]|nr:flagellar motor stator protein MotA [Robiginitomaculum sp.]